MSGAIGPDDTVGRIFVRSPDRIRGRRGNNAKSFRLLVLPGLISLP